MTLRKFKISVLLVAIISLGVVFLFSMTPSDKSSFKKELKPYDPNLGPGDEVRQETSYKTQSSLSDEENDDPEVHSSEDLSEGDLVSIVSGPDEVLESLADSLKVDKENIRLVRINYGELNRITKGTVLTLPTVDEGLVDFYVSDVSESGGELMYVEGHLEGYDAGYLMGLTIDKGGSIDGVFLTDVGKYRIYTIQGREVLEKSEVLPSEVYQ